MTARTGQWRETAGVVAGRWTVARVDDHADLIRTGAGNPKTWRRRAHAYAYAEQLNRQDAARLDETLKELGL